MTVKTIPGVFCSTSDTLSTTSLSENRCSTLASYYFCKKKSSMETIRFAVIGSGHIGKRHAEMAHRNPHAELVAMCDCRSKEDCLVPYDVPFFQDVDEMLNTDLEIDVVCICTPNGLHAEHAVKALKAKKHVVVEKPMALSKADCEKVIYTALNVSRQIFCVMQNRYSPPSAWLKGLIEAGTLGDIYMVQINCYWNRDDRYYDKVYWKGTQDLDGGTLFTQFSHFLDIMYWLFGDITNIQSRFRDFNHGHNTEFEDSGLVMFDFVNGGLGSINFSTAVNDKNYESSMTIVGEKGTVKVGGQYMNEVDSQMIRVNLNNIGDHLDLVIKIVTTFTVIKANLDQYHAQSHNSMDSIAFLNKKFENINNVIDTYNAYVLDVRTNPFIRSQYEPIENVSLEGVWLIGRSGKVDSIGSAPVIDESVMPKSLPTSQEDRIAIGEVFK